MQGILVMWLHVVIIRKWFYFKLTFVRTLSFEPLSHSLIPKIFSSLLDQFLRPCLQTNFSCLATLRVALFSAEIPFSRGRDPLHHSKLVHRSPQHPGSTSRDCQIPIIHNKHRAILLFTGSVSEENDFFASLSLFPFYLIFAFQFLKNQLDFCVRIRCVCDSLSVRTERTNAICELHNHRLSSCCSTISLPAGSRW